MYFCCFLEIVMKLRFTVVALLGLLQVNISQAARIDTLSVYSEKMNRSIPVVVVVPDRIASGEQCPVLYLLHGYGGDAFSWLKIKPELIRMVDQDGILVVCPDGEKSWYWDSPVNRNSQFETFVSKELVHCIDSRYTTVDSRKGRAIAGLSMGGHGALWLAIRHKDVFGAAGSMSGGVDIRPFPDSWEMKAQLGPKEENTSLWERHTVINQADKLQDGELRIILDCGTDDFFFEVNRRLHERLLKQGVGHDYVERPGSHDLPYWNNSMDYQWVFFRKFFAGH